MQPFFDRMPPSKIPHIRRNSYTGTGIQTNKLTDSQTDIPTQLIERQTDRHRNKLRDLYVEQQVTKAWKECRSYHQMPLVYRLFFYLFFVRFYARQHTRHRLLR